MFWWKGVYVVLSYPEGHDTQETIEWDNELFHSEKPKQVYMASTSLCIVALVITAVLFIFLLFTINLRSFGTRHHIAPCYPCRISWIASKWTSFSLCVIVFILSCLSWGIFLMYPSALKDAMICPSYLVRLPLSSPPPRGGV